MTGKQHAAAGISKTLERIECAAANRPQARNDNNIVGHLADLEPRSGRHRWILLRKQSFADVVEVEQVAQQPLRDLLELPLELFALVARLREWPVAEPVGLDGVQHADAHVGAATAQHDVEARKVILDQPVLLPPRRLVVD